MTILNDCLIFSNNEINAIGDTLEILYKIPAVIKDEAGSIGAVREGLADILDAVESVEVKGIKFNKEDIENVKIKE